MGIEDKEAGATFSVDASEVRDTEAVAMESRERTRSNGYVEPRSYTGQGD